MMDIL